MKKKNQTDGTLRNVRAANKKLENHEKRIKKIESLLIAAWRLDARVKNLEQRTKGLL